MPNFKVNTQSQASKTAIGEVIGRTFKQDTAKNDATGKSEPYIGKYGGIPLQVLSGKIWLFAPTEIEPVE